MYDDATLLDSVANITGYPGDKPAGRVPRPGRYTLAVHAEGHRPATVEVEVSAGQGRSVRVPLALSG